MAGLIGLRGSLAVALRGSFADGVAGVSMSSASSLLLMAKSLLSSAKSRSVAWSSSSGEAMRLGDAGGVGAKVTGGTGGSLTGGLVMVSVAFGRGTGATDVVVGSTASGDTDGGVGLIEATAASTCCRRRLAA